MCSLFLVLTQLQLMPKQEYRLSRKKYKYHRLTNLEVPVDRSPAQVETAHQGIDALGGQCLGLTGQMGVAVGGQDGVVARGVIHKAERPAG